MAEQLVIEITIHTCQNLTPEYLKSIPFYEYHQIMEIIQAKGRGEEKASKSRANKIKKK